jgi:hypothetical protein
MTMMMDDSNSHSQQPNLGVVFDRHIKHEFEDHDVDATMQTMTKEPYVHHVPIMTGGVGYQEVYNFYKNHFIGKMPADTKIVRISRTIGKDQVVDEVIISFTVINSLSRHYKDQLDDIYLISDQFLSSKKIKGFENIAEYYEVVSKKNRTSIT